MNQESWSYKDGDLELEGEIYRPALENANGAAVLVVHEADGIGGNVREHCARLTELGYIAAAADMHGEGRVLESEEMHAALARFRADPELLRRRVRAAFDAICMLDGVHPSRVAAIGFCFGGLAVLELARSGAPIAAVASFHGLLTTAAPAGPGDIKARVLAATGALDPLVPPRDIATFQQEMSEAGVDWHLLVHGRALHSYTNHAVANLGDPRMAYDPDAHQLSWATLTSFMASSFPYH
jgi:dienelactone hydrolase